MRCIIHSFHACSEAEYTPECSCKICHVNIALKEKFYFDILRYFCCNTLRNEYYNAMAFHMPVLMESGMEQDVPNILRAISGVDFCYNLIHFLSINMFL